MPAHPLALAISAAAGPLAVTSANISGNPTPATCDELFSSFGDAVAVYLCEEEPLAGRTSTVVDLAHGEPRLLRSGALEAAELEALLRA
jgi:tRNA A37 threonylcarbamoyladenosine synthetase subunit TsaC/SUA5/YrdC